MKTLLTALIVMMSLSTALASSCNYIERSISNTRDDLRELSWEDNEISRKLSNVRRELRLLERQIDNARNELTSAKNQLDTLRSDYYNSDQLIPSYRVKRNQASAELLPLELKERKLKQKYKGIKVNLLNSYKRVKVRRKWKKAERNADAKRSQLSSYTSKLRYYENLVQNFPALEDSALSRIESAEDQFDDALSNDTEISQLKRRRNRLQSSSNRIGHRKSRLQSRLSHQKSDLRRCRNNY